VLSDEAPAPSARLQSNYHRTYDPSTGRYLERDPIGLEGGLNLYQYALGDPLQFTDPEGLEPLFNYGGALNFYGNTTLQALAAFGDGAIPFFDPFSDFYDPCDPTLKGSRLAGELTFSAELTLLSGPRGPLFGRARYRNGNAGLFNRSNWLRLGWSWSGGRNRFGFHGGIPRTPRHWHRLPIPGPRGPLW
jgi:RHS repeat-associated protein